MTSPGCTPRSAAGPAGSTPATTTPVSPAPATLAAGASFRPEAASRAVAVALVAGVRAGFDGVGSLPSVSAA